MKGNRTGLIAVAAFVVGMLALVGAGNVLAAGPVPNAQGSGPSGGMMDGGYGGGMMGGQVMGGGMMGAWVGQTTPNQGNPISIDQAEQSVQSYVDALGNGDLAVDEIMEFQNNFYAIVREKSSGVGAFELLVNKYTGVVGLEYGPNMMWNTKYGMMGGRGGMMGGWFGQSGNQPAGQNTVTADQAQKDAQAWLDQNEKGSTTEQPDQFYGYYTVHVLKDGKSTGMLSVNGFTGQIWYHTWHGTFVQQKELSQ